MKILLEGSRIPICIFTPPPFRSTQTTVVIVHSSETLYAPGTFQNIPLTETPGNGVQTAGNGWQPPKKPIYSQIDGGGPTIDLTSGATGPRGVRK